MDDQISPQPSNRLARTGRALLNVSLVVAMVLVASLIGVGGAAIFIYKQMGNSVSVAKSPAKKANVYETEATRPKLTPIEQDSSERHAVVPTVGDSNEWHFAEFSDKPRYIDVTYDGGRQHARLKVNTVLSSKPNIAAASSSVSDTEDDAPYNANNLPNGDSSVNLAADPGSRYITDKRTGRVIGIDGTAGANQEVRRAQPVAPTIRNPVPEVRVASPVLQYGRPIFDDDSQPVQRAMPASTYLPSRKAIPVNPDDPDSAANAYNSGGTQSVRRAQPVFREPSPAQYDQIFELSDRTSVFRRNN